MLSKDETYMQRAIEIAARGEGRVSPNPLVGAVIVKNGRVIGEGAHERCGDLHAERNALKDCQARGEDPFGATIYVTLEPCCHQGRQPPCTSAILEAGIARVVVGAGDPNPQVAGKGIRILRDAGIKVETGCMEQECRRLARIFLHYVETGHPLVVLKYAMTMDGKIAAYTGESKWITGKKARAHVHRVRNRCKAIMVGLGTVLADDPMLNARFEGAVDPIRIVCDSHLRTPLDAKVVTTAREIPTILATCEKDSSRQAPYLETGCEVLCVAEKGGRVDLADLVMKLGRRGVDSVLIEGGGTLAWAAAEAGIVDLVYAYIAPKILGGKTAKTPVEGQGFSTPGMGLQLADVRVTRLGEDILIESEVLKRVHGNR